ncbi:MAG: hypothetical protein K2X38_03545 [Gemmataceae bacterium]|nr:hypothetical protein [Gemmataceae bacterium]
MRAVLTVCFLAILAPASARAQVQFVPYNPVLPPFRSVSFSRDVLPPLIVNPAPANQVFVVIDANDLMARRTIVDLAAPLAGDSRYGVNPVLGNVISPFMVDRNIIPAGLPVVADSNYAVHAAIASVAPGLNAQRTVVSATAAPVAESRPPITLASIKPQNARPNDARYPGWFVLSETDMAERLRLTPAQKAEIEKATDEKTGGVRSAEINSDEENRQYATQRRASRERFLQMLSVEQQQMWTQLTGDPYEFRPN